MKQPEPTEKEPCPVCNGTGFYHVPNDVSADQRTPARCSWCRGTGLASSEPLPMDDHR